METIREDVPERKEHPEDKSACGKWLQALGHCINKPIVFKRIKIMGFTALLILVFLVYGFEIYTKFQDQATTFKTKRQEADNFNLPPITICMGNGLKPTVMKKYGISSIFDFVSGSESVRNMSSVWDVFLEGAYMINREFKIISGFLTLEKGHNYLRTNNEGDGFDINITEYHTISTGTCYQINSNLPLPPPNMGILKLQFNESLGKTDTPQVIIVIILQKVIFAKLTLLYGYRVLFLHLGI